MGRVGFGRQTLQKPRVLTRRRRYGSGPLAVCSCGQDAFPVALATSVLALAAVRVAFVEGATLLIVLASGVAYTCVTALAVQAVVVSLALNALAFSAERRACSAFSIVLARSIGDATLRVAAQRAKIGTIRIGADGCASVVIGVRTVAGAAGLHAGGSSRRVIGAIDIGRTRAPRNRANVGRA